MYVLEEIQIVATWTVIKNITDFNVQFWLGMNIQCCSVC